MGVREESLRERKTHADAEKKDAGIIAHSCPEAEETEPALKKSR